LLTHVNRVRPQLLGAYLPGPLNIVKDVLLAKAGSDDMQVGCPVQSYLFN